MQNLWDIILGPLFFYANRTNSDQTPRSATSDRVHTVFQCPFYEAVGINGFIFFEQPILHSIILS